MRIVEALKKLADKMGIENVAGATISEVISSMADNYPEEEAEENGSHQ